VREPDHLEFLQSLAHGRNVERAVALHLLDAGLCVRTGRPEQAATPYEGHRFRDEYDLIVNEHHLLEIKSSSRRFEGPDDFPFPGAYTCTVQRWQERQRKPLAFVIVSTPTGGAIAVSSKTFPDWEIIDSADARRDGWVTPTYRAPKSVLRPLADLVHALMTKEAT
jgi:hypothetical protein